MPLASGMMNCALRVVGDRGRNTTDMKRGAIGTAFAIRVPSERLSDTYYWYLLTAHHVIARQTNIEVEIPDPANESALQPPLSICDWRQPLDGVDLAVAPFFDRERKLMPLDLDKHVVYASSANGPYIGTSVHYIGLLDPDDRLMARSGNIGALDQTDLHFREGYRYTAHLVDCRSYGGFSGSPVFANLTYGHLDETKPPMEPPEGIRVGAMLHLAMLCGMFTAHRTDTNPDGTVSRYGVGVVLPSDEIRKALMVDKLKKERQVWDAERGRG